MDSLDSILDNSLVREEYKKTVLLSMFRKICVRMNTNSSYRQKIRNLFRQTNDRKMTARILVEKEFNVCLSDSESSMLEKWFSANLRKQPKRNQKYTCEAVKQELLIKQNGICPSCGEPLGADLSKIHVDHIIPFVLVGDELEDNYQDLCETCNECKGARVDYLFGKLIKTN